MKKLTIAIDGPSSSGKSTIAKIIANKLNLLYIDTGAMYRCVALKKIEEPKKSLNKILDEIKIELKKDGRVLLNNQDVTEKIRTSEVTKLASPLSAKKQVREKLTKMQKELAKDGNVIMEGRDITTVVLPHADIKIFLTASLEERTKRRYKELIEKGYNVSYDKIKEEINKRDYQDSTRKLAPLLKAEDAIEVDTDNKNIEEVVEEIMKIIKKNLIR